MKRVLHILAALLPLAAWAQAQPADEATRTEVRVTFPVSVARLDPGLDGNGARLDSAVSLIKRSLDADAARRLVAVEFFGWASPEGPYALNQSLSRRRRDAVAAYVGRRVALPDSLVVMHPAAGINWPGLLQAVLADTLTPDRAAVLDILHNEPELTRNARGRVVASRMGRLRALPAAWAYMLRNHFPALRRAGLLAITLQPAPAPAPAPESEPTPASAPAPTPEPTPAPVPAPDSIATIATIATIPSESPAEAPAAPLPPRYWSLHTNLLYDALLLPNVGAEVYLGRNVSLMGNWMYGWWDQRSIRRWWRAYGGELSVRYWFGSLARQKPLQGHHFGLYGQVFTYDFEWGKTGYLGGVPGKNILHSPSYTFGVEYGFAMPIARRLNLDLNVGVGYFGGKYYKYNPRDGHWVWRGTHQRSYFGPTKLEVSLVYLLGRGNVNKKGGAK